MAINTIDTAMAKKLVLARSVKYVTIVGRPGGWSVIFKLNVGERWLAAQRSKLVRIWRSLDRCVAFMKGELGLARFSALDASQYSPDGPTQRVRTDAAERMRHAHEAAAHDLWFREQVSEGVRDLDAGHVTSEEAHDPIWDLSGIVYLPHALFQIKGLVSPASNAPNACFTLVAYDNAISGTGQILAEPACTNAPTTLVPISRLVQ